MASSPETCRRLGTFGLKGSQQGRPSTLWRKLLQIEFGGLLQVADSLLHRGSLAGRPHLGTLRNPEVAFLVQNRAEDSGCHVLNNYSRIHHGLASNLRITLELPGVIDPISNFASP